VRSQILSLGAADRQYKRSPPRFEPIESFRETLPNYVLESPLFEML